jgi:hypothetical protein
MMLQILKDEKLKLRRQKELRNDILGFEAQLKQDENVLLGDNILCPLKHSFSDGIYVREIFLPAGTMLTGKIHKHAHPNFLMSGKVEVITEGGGYETLQGPVAMMSKAGTKRAVNVLEDAVWITVHHNPTNTQDLKELEKIVIADSYEEYERFTQKEIGLFKKVLKFLKLTT